jgi:hypothetical protein
MMNCSLSIDDEGLWQQILDKNNNKRYKAIFQTIVITLKIIQLTHMRRTLSSTKIQLQETE